jgi:hypothetical protein
MKKWNIQNDIDHDYPVIAIAFKKFEESETNDLKDDDDDEDDYDNEKPDSKWNGIGSVLFKSAMRSFLMHYRSITNFKHCEICFKLSDKKNKSDFSRRNLLFPYVAFYARSDRGVEAAKRKFSDNYEWQFLHVNREERCNMLQFLLAQIGKPYNLHAVQSVFTNPPLTDGKSWYCVQIVATALQFLPCVELHKHPANAIDIDELYECIKKSTRLAKNNARYNLCVIGEATLEVAQKMLGLPKIK